MDGEALLVAERFFHAIEAGDAEAIARIYAPDACIWHNFSQREQTVEENLKVLRWMAHKLPDRRYEVLRRVAIPGGFMQQHVVRGMLADGADFAMPACVICLVEDGRITRLEEYLDPAQAAVLSA
ncbi:MAG: nuclear transport factor 2 family protein [Parvibaculum sp.]|uniref:nuclear transport factor 2 family protein n=1 Tax=Parvibaculum sp. TaxID=2024848 RepID=UPI00271BA740|nr:nuclear transport factor 2 family protein [Parvibaculum sp.]MDO8837597.1 nuclear transport factor 2 family protein [Parvibaculum sp.]